MMPNREGIFHAYPVEIGLGQTRENALLQAVIKYRMFEELASGEWVDCSAENLEISGYHILEKRDHTLNTTTIEALKAALGWDGADPFWLQDNAETLSQQPVQIKLVFEEFGGSTRLKVAFLNPYGSKGGGVPKADDQMRRAVANRLGSKFRAMAGGTSAPAPKPAGRPMPAKPPSPAKAAPTGPVATAEAPAPATMEQAWEEFTKHCPPPKWDQEAIEREWFRVLCLLFPGKQPGELTPTEWGTMRDRGPSEIIPF